MHPDGNRVAAGNAVSPGGGYRKESGSADLLEDGKTGWDYPLKEL